ADGNLGSPATNARRSRRRSLLVGPGVELGELDPVPAGVVQHGDRRTGRLGEGHPLTLQALVLLLEVAHEAHHRRHPLLVQRLLVGLARRDERARLQHQLDAGRLLGRHDRQPAVVALAEVRLLLEAQLLRVETEGLLLIGHIEGHRLDLHVDLLVFCAGFVFCTGFDLLVRFPPTLRATAARTRSLKAAWSSASPSRMSMARRRFPPRLELKRRAGSSRKAPLANVSLTTLLYV